MADSGVMEALPPYIDHGYAWVVTFGAFMTQFFVLGFGKSFGIFYVDMLEYFEVKRASDLAWVLSLNGCVAMGVGPIATTLGLVSSNRLIVMLGGVLMCIGLVLSAVTPNMYFLYFSYSIVVGVGLGFAHSTSIVQVAQYFSRRRALANGIAVSGSGVGSFFFPPITRLCLDTYGLRGALLLSGAIVLNTSASGALLTPISFYKKHRKLKKETEMEVVTSEIKTELDDASPAPDSDSVLIEEKALVDKRNSVKAGDLTAASVQSIPELVDPEKSKRKSLFSCCNKDPTLEKKKLFHWNLLRNRVFILFQFSIFFSTMGYAPTFMMTPAFTKENGISKSDTAILLSVAGLSDLVGRLLLGWFFDLNYFPKRYGYCTGMCLAGISALLIPLVPPTFWSLMAFLALFGFCAGAYVVLIAVLLVEILGVEKLANSYGITVVSQGFSLLISIPLSTWIHDVTGSWANCFYLCGALLITGACFALPPHRRCQQESDQNQ